MDPDQAKNKASDGETESGLRGDVAKILNEITLPGKRMFHAKADVQRPNFQLPQSSAPVTVHREAAPARIPVSPPRAEEKSPDTVPHIQEIPLRAAPETSTLSGPSIVQQLHDVKSDDQLAPVRTLKFDLQELVKEKKMSLVRAATLESEKRRKRDEAASGLQPQRPRRRVVGYVVGIFFFFVIGFAAIAAVLLIENERAQPAQQVSESALMFAENTLVFPLTEVAPRETKQRLAAARTQLPITLGAITRIVPLVSFSDIQTGEKIERPVNTREFLDALGARPGDDLVRAFDDEFFFGMHSIGETVPVFVTSIRSYERAFAGMLAWEARLNEDWAPIFSLSPHEARKPDGTLSLSRFEDAIIRNFDVRVLKDPEGNVRMMYSFPTQDILIIAESAHTLTETLARLQAQRRI